jgi:hypothetical protein
MILGEIVVGYHADSLQMVVIVDLLYSPEKKKKWYDERVLKRLRIEECCKVVIFKQSKQFPIYVSERLL